MRTGNHVSHGDFPPDGLSPARTEAPEIPRHVAVDGSPDISDACGGSGGSSAYPRGSEAAGGAPGRAGVSGDTAGSPDGSSVFGGED
jgi:hypothetical protein